jgi:hypothetical protein
LDGFRYDFQDPRMLFERFSGFRLPLQGLLKRVTGRILRISNQFQRSTEN